MKPRSKGGPMTHGWRIAVLAVLLAVGLAAGIAVPPAAAHWADQAVAEIVVAAREVRVTLTFPTGLAAFADTDRDGRISPAELAARRPELTAFLAGRLIIRGQFAAIQRAAVPGVLRVEPAAAEAPLQSISASPATHTTLLLTYSWPQEARSVHVRYDLFLPNVPTASLLAAVLHGGDVTSVVFTPEHREASISVDRSSQLSDIAGFIALGARHILSGYDHLLFLLSLLMVGGSLLPLARTVTAFTLAHSVTLSLAVLGVVAFPARWVESVIALSIMYVAGENLWRRTIETRRRWVVTFGFGLVHGLGFASALREMALPRGALAASLVGFNVGVELGQIAVVLAASAVLQIVKTWPREAALRRWISAGAVAAGFVWFVERALLGG
jgi:hypothetical protein